LIKNILHWMVFLLILVVSYNSMDRTFFVQTYKVPSEPAMNNIQDTDLYTKILDQVERYSKAPVNAKVDPVWKAIPGYNGLKVDVKASYEQMKKKNKYNENNLVFKQIVPEVTLKDLPPNPIYKGNPEKPMVTFLINVAWGNEYLPTLIEVLKENNVHTTFFLDGSWVKKNPDLAKMIQEEGHEIGNHAYTHPDLKSMTAVRIQEELKKTNDVIKATLNVTPKLFAPPSGSYKDDVVTIATKMDMYTILWSLDTVDWRKPEPNEMANLIISKVHPGAMILMHPTESTAKGIDSMIKGIQNKGYEIGTVSQLLSEKRVIKRISSKDE
jgi:probable sporulation protein (polysaccharide deacetylase family)